MRDADGKVVETLTTDENGHATSGLLAIGTYKDGKFDKAATYYLVAVSYTHLEAESEE